MKVHLKNLGIFKEAAFEVNESGIVLNLELDTGQTCRFTEDLEEQFAEIPESQELDCFLSLTGNYMCRGSLPVTGAHKYRILCNENIKVERHLQPEATEVIYYRK